MNLLGLIASAVPKFSQLRSKLEHLWNKEIWAAAHVKDTSVRGWGYATLRVLSITWTVFSETKAASRAAALSFSSLLGLGPLVALTVLVAGFALGKKDDSLAANTLGSLISFIAPQVGQYGKLPEPHPTTPLGAKISEASTATPAASRSETNPPAVPPTPVLTAAEKQLAEAAKLAAIKKSIGDAQAEVDVAQSDLDLLTANAGSQGAIRKAEQSLAQANLKLARAQALAPGSQLNPRLVGMMRNFIDQGTSGSAGTFGFFSLIIIVLLLFKTVEDTFNEIWGVRSGRSLLMRVVYYWTVLTLGAVLFFASVTLLGAGAFLTVFNKTVVSHLPFSQQISVALQWSLPAFSFALLVVLLTGFYRVIPNTRVFWRAAFAGAVVVALLLMLNNFLAFLYVRRVLLTESLYGGPGFPLVVMFGLYIFWLYVLIGGQISYAVQNVHFRNSQAAWSSLSEAMRERLLLVVLLTICRRFQDCLPPVAASHLGNMIKVPTQILNECLNRLVDLKLITPLPADPDADATDHLFQPARPLNRITLSDFKRLDDNYGDDPVGSALEQLDPILVRYTQAMDKINEQEFFLKTLEQHFAEQPFNETHAPFKVLTQRR